MGQGLKSKLWPNDSIKVLAHEAIAVCVELSRKWGADPQLLDRAHSVSEMWSNLGERYGQRSIVSLEVPLRKSGNGDKMGIENEKTLP